MYLYINTGSSPVHPAILFSSIFALRQVFRGGSLEGSKFWVYPIFACFNLFLSFIGEQARPIGGRLRLCDRN